MPLLSCHVWRVDLSPKRLPVIQSPITHTSNFKLSLLLYLLGKLISCSSYKMLCGSFHSFKVHPTVTHSVHPLTQSLSRKQCWHLIHSSSRLLLNILNITRSTANMYFTLISCVVIFSFFFVFWYFVFPFQKHLFIGHVPDDLIHGKILPPSLWFSSSLSLQL